MGGDLNEQELKNRPKKGEEKKKSIKDTEAWNSADFDYAGLMAQDMMPLLGAPLTGQER